MTFNKDALLAKAQAVVQFIKRYGVFMCILAFSGLYAYLIISINTLTQSEPTPDRVSEKQQTIKSIKVDQQSIEKMQQLEDQNIEIKSLFKQARDSPFNE